MTRVTLSPLILVLAAWMPTPAAAGDEEAPASLAVAEESPPSEIAEPIRGVLGPQIFRLSGSEQPFFEFWLRKEIPLAENPSDEASALAALKEGTLLGVVRVSEERYDFKDEEIPPGVYVMRFGLQPEDGNHQGTSPTPTFALLVPADKDRDLETFPGHDQLVEASKTINAAGHPSILNLQPIEKAHDQYPRLAEQSEGQHKVVCLRLPAKVEGRSETVQLTFSLVYEGMGHF